MFALGAKILFMHNSCTLGSVHKLREGGGVGDLRGDLKIFYTVKGGPEMLPEH